MLNQWLQYFEPNTKSKGVVCKISLQMAHFRELLPGVVG